MMRFLFLLIYLPSLAFAQPKLPNLSSPPPTDARAAFLKVMKTPTILILKEFKTICDASRTYVDFENDQKVYDQLSELKKRPDLVKLRVLLHAANACTQDKSKASLIEFLGVDMIVKYPVLTIRALHNESLVDKLALPLMEAEPDELAGADCSTPECQGRRRQAFKEKRDVLERAKIRKSEEDVRSKLLAALKSDK
jgi:hypothetical protein